MAARHLDQNTMGYLQWRRGPVGAVTSSLVRDTKSSRLTLALQVQELLLLEEEEEEEETDCVVLTVVLVLLQLGLAHSYLMMSYQYKFQDQDQTKVKGSVKYVTWRRQKLQVLRAASEPGRIRVVI